MIKTWQERIVTANPPYVDPEEINKAMLEEIDELRADAARYRDALNEAVKGLTAQGVSLAADAARYQWITKQITADTFDNLEKAFGVFGDAESCTQAEFDACIDAAMKEANHD